MLLCWVRRPVRGRRAPPLQGPAGLGPLLRTVRRGGSGKCLVGVSLVALSWQPRSSRRRARSI